MPLLQVTDLAVRYGDIQVVWKADINVEKGSIVAMIGSNGAGKTTILRALSGQLPVYDGEILLNNEPVTNLPPAELVGRGLIHVPEGRKLFPGLTVQDNLLLGAYLRTDRKAVTRDMNYVFEIFPRLRERRLQDAVTLSGGEQQMCAIGRGLMASPKLLLIDELSLGLAPKAIDELVAALRKINQAGTSLLVVEQDVAAALDLADHVYVVDQGRTVLSGSAAELAKNDDIRKAYLGVEPS